MASITSLTGSSSTSSIYGNSNVISGLASGLDTESMIENAVSGIKDRIAGLNQDREMLEWERDAYRSIIDKLSDFSDKYLSFGSNTNLLSNSFYNNATKVTATGTYASMVSATGSTSSDFKILSATAATAATYSGIGSFASGEGVTVTASTKLKDLVGTGKFTINNVEIEVTEKDTVSSLVSKINNSKAGVQASFSSITGAFYLKAKTTGENSKVEFGDVENSALSAADLFGTAGEGKNKAVEGKNAVMTMEINGTEETKEQASNEFNIDGMKVTLKGDIAQTDSANAVSFTSTVDSSKIVDAIKSMIEDYNTMANEVRTQYATQPLRDSKGKRYEPLLAEDAEDMSDSEIQKYEAKAKTGILFGDSDLSSLYDEMRSAVSSLDLEAIGINTAYNAGKTTLSLDEDKLRSVLENDPNKVRETLTQSVSDGDSKDGALTKLQNTIKKYAKTSGATRGVLVNLAGSEKSPMSLNDNTYKGKLERIEEQVKRWETKLSTKIDFYTKQFSALEQMISKMNSQSSALSGMMGY